MLSTTSPSHDRIFEALSLLPADRHTVAVFDHDDTDFKSVAGIFSGGKKSASEEASDTDDLFAI